MESLWVVDGQRGFGNGWLAGMSATMNPEAARRLVENGRPNNVVANSSGNRDPVLYARQ